MDEGRQRREPVFPAPHAQTDGPEAETHASEASTRPLDDPVVEAEVAAIPNDPDHRLAAVERLVRDHHADLYRYAFRLTGNPADAEDITQQTFLTAHTKWEQLRDPAKARQWLFSILRSCFLKSRRRAPPTVASTLNVNMDTFPQESATDASDHPWDEERLRWALTQLSDESRLLLNMFYYEKASYREIAEALNIKLGTVMSRLSRAKEKLRRMLYDVAVVSLPVEEGSSQPSHQNRN